MEAPAHGMNYREKRCQTEKKTTIYNHDLSVTEFELLEVLDVEP